MGTMLVLVLTTGVTFLATFSPPGSVAATAEGYLYPSSSPLPPGIPTQESGAVKPTPSSSHGDPYHYSPTPEDPLPIAGDVGAASVSISAPSSSASIASGVISGDEIDEIDSIYGHFSPGLPITTEPSANRTVEETLAQELAAISIRDSLSVAVPMTVVYVVILLSGLLGNISTCIVIAKNTYMHTATNYYLFSLAMSDLLLLICGLPQEIYHIWKKYPYLFGDTFCVIRGLAAETSANATVLTITAFTVERFVAIVYPLKSHKISQLSRVVRMIGFIWVVAFCLALPQAAQFGIVDEVSPSYSHIVLIKGAWCTIAREIFPYAFEISSCVFFVIPMTIITVLYVLIGLKLRRPRGGSGSNSEEMNVEPRNISNRHSQSHVIRMLVAVVVAFFICWAPFHAQRFMALYGRAYELERHELYQSIYQGVHYISGILYYISTCINPILYHIMSNKFRQAFKDTLSRFCGKPNSRLQHRTYSAISHRSSRMGVRNHHQFSSVRKPPETDTCFKCRRTSSICICKGISNNTGNNHHLHHHHHKNKLNHLKSFQMDQSGSESTSLTLLNSSPSEKDVVIAMTAVEKSQGPLCPSPRSQHQSSPPPLAQPSAHPTSGLRAFLSRSKKNPVGTNNNSGDFRGSSPLANGVRNEKRSWGLNNKNNNKMNLGSIRPPSDPALQSTFAVTLLDGKGNSKTAVLRPRTGSSGNAAVILATYNKTAARATSYSSVDSGKSNNTISNSSLQDMDESEYTGEELAGYMAELNHSLDSPKK